MLNDFTIADGHARLDYTFDFSVTQPFKIKANLVKRRRSLPILDSKVVAFCINTVVYC
jgi:hypothetical protein